LKKNNLVFIELKRFTGIKIYCSQAVGCQSVPQQITLHKSFNLIPTSAIQKVITLQHATLVPSFPEEANIPLGFQLSADSNYMNKLV
jgi:hypothetical protein